MPNYQLHAKEMHCDESVYIDMYNAVGYIYFRDRMEIMGILYRDFVGNQFKQNLFNFQDPELRWDEFMIIDKQVAKIQSLINRK